VVEGLVGGLVVIGLQGTVMVLVTGLPGVPLTGGFCLNQSPLEHPPLGGCLQ
jgi:hypothetical protein